MLIKQTRHLHLVKRLFMPVIVIGLFVVSIVSYSPNIKATAGVPGNPAFTDINFYTCVLTELDSMNAKPSIDGIARGGRVAEGAEVYNATDYELGLITDLECDNKNIANTSGLEKIAKLEFLVICDNPLANIDLSKNTSLEIIYVGNSHNSTIQKIEKLDLSSNINIGILVIGDNPLLTDVTVHANSPELLNEFRTFYVFGGASNLKLVKLIDNNGKTFIAYRNGRIVKVNGGSLLSDLSLITSQLVGIQLGFDSIVDVDTNTGYSYLMRSFQPTDIPTTTDSTGNLISSDRILISGDLIKAPYVILEKIDNVYSEYKKGQLDIRIAINGDVVSDGEIKIGDVAKLYRHFRGRDVMTDEVLLAAGDVIADGEIKIGDVAQLYRYFRGRISSL